MKIASEAMSALAEFSAEDHTANVLPPSALISRVECGDESAPVSSRELVRLVLAVPGCPCPGLYDFLRATAHSELVDVPRGLVYTAMQQAQAPHQRDQDIEKLWALLKTVVSGQPCQGMSTSE